MSFQCLLCLQPINIVDMQSACTLIKDAIGIKNLMGKNPKINKKFDCNKQNSVGKNPKINNRFGLLIQHGRVI